MAADDDKAKGAESGSGARSAPERRTRERRQKPPVTIDLAAEPAKDKGKSEPAARPAAASSPAPSASDRPGDKKTDTAPASAPEKLAPAQAGASGPGTSRPGGADALRGMAARALSPDDGWRRMLVAAISGALVALILVVVLQAIGLLPSSGRATANAAADQAKSAVDTAVALERRVSAIEAMVENLPALRSDVKAIGDRVAALESAAGGLVKHSDLDALTAAVAALRERLDAMPVAAARSDLAALSDRVGRLEVTAAAGGTGGGDNSAAIDSLTGQLTAAEANLRSLNDRLAAAEAKMKDATPATGDRAVRAIAVASLRRAAAGDAPFVSDVDMISALGVANDEIAKLRPIATAGVASVATLADEFPAVADAILSASVNSDPNANFFQRIVNGLGSLVTIRPTGPIAGDDPQAIVSRMTADVAAGDLAGALKERAGLPQAGQDASADWAKAAADRVALDKLIAQIAVALDTPKP